MSWELIWTRPAIHDLQRLDREAAERVRLAVRRFAESERGHLRRLQGGGGEWALRAGEWRVRFEYDRELNAMIVLRVLPRGRAYRD